MPPVPEVLQDSVEETDLLLLLQVDFLLLCSAKSVTTHPHSLFQNLWTPLVCYLSYSF